MFYPLNFALPFPLIYSQRPKLKFSSLQVAKRTVVVVIKFHPHKLDFHFLLHSLLPFPASAHQSLAAEALLHLHTAGLQASVIPLHGTVMELPGMMGSPNDSSHLLPGIHLSFETSVGSIDRRLVHPLLGSSGHDPVQLRMRGRLKD